MATFTFTYMPLLLVLQDGGSMNLRSLARKLNEASQRHFPDISSVERAIDDYSGCLKIEDGDRVVFDRSSKRYAKFDIMEDHVDYLLHEHVKDMKRFELYESDGRNPFEEEDL